jgi:hypothetical protein
VTTTLPQEVVARLPRRLVDEQNRLASRVADARRAVRQLQAEFKQAREQDARAECASPRASKPLPPQTAPKVEERLGDAEREESALRGALAEAHARVLHQISNELLSEVCAETRERELEAWRDAADALVELERRVAEANRLAQVRSWTILTAQRTAPITSCNDSSTADLAHLPAIRAEVERRLATAAGAVPEPQGFVIEDFSGARLSG